MEKQTLITLLLFSDWRTAERAGVPQFGGSESSVYDLVEEELGEFNFVRVQYDTYWGGGFGYGTWSIDFPDADMNFLRGVSRLTNIKVERDPIVLRFDDEQIFDYPFLYMLEVGQNGGIVLSPKETENLREYSLRGGFLLIDDFWGQRQWDNFMPRSVRFFQTGRSQN